MKVINLYRILFFKALVFSLANWGIAEERSLKLATEDWPPFSYYDQEKGEVGGLSTEIVNAVLSRMKVTVEGNKVYPWIRTQSLAYDGGVDAVYTASINEERKKHCYFPSEPLVTSQWVLFIKKSNKERLSFNSFEDLKDKRVGLIKGYNYPADFAKYVEKHCLRDEVLLEVTNIKKLMGERFEYMPAVLETTLHFAKNSPDLKALKTYENLYYFPKPLATTHFYLMFSKKTVPKEFVEEFSKALVEFKKTKEYQQILTKYYK